jgi:hypothetical protein
MTQPLTVPRTPELALTLRELVAILRLSETLSARDGHPVLCRQGLDNGDLIARVASALALILAGEDVTANWQTVLLVACHATAARYASEGLVSSSELGQAA